jgi:hypothetical protein
MSELALTDRRDPLLRVYVDDTQPQAYVVYRHAGGANRATTLRAHELPSDPSEAWRTVKEWVAAQEKGPDPQAG